MKKANNTKQTLVMSVLSLVLCMSMLIGTTFAWFTDSATSGVNKIVSGNLDIGVYYATPEDVVDGDIPEANWKVLNEQNPVFKDAALWEPGYTEVVFFKFVNEGSLALQYQLQVDILDEVIGKTKNNEAIQLSNYIEAYACNSFTWDYTNYLFTDRNEATNPAGAPNPFHDTLYNAANGEAATPNGANPLSLDSWQWLEDDETTYATLVLWMPTTVGNEANHNGTDIPSIDLGVSVVATQYTHESDSFDDQYDAEAKFPVLVKDAAGLNDALANAIPGTVISLSEDVDYGKATVGELKDVVIEGAKDAKLIFSTDANSKIENVTLNKVEFEYDGSAADCGVVINENAEIDNLVIENCTFTGTGAKAGRGLSGYNNNASIVIKDCTFENLGYPIYAWGGYESLTVDNCTFTNIKSWAIMPQSGFDGDLTVNNCKFNNCLGGGLIKAGTLTAGHTFTFTNNTIEDCTVAGDHNWFQFNVSAGNLVVENNIKDGSAWTPGVAEGLK